MYTCRTPLFQSIFKSIEQLHTVHLRSRKTKNFKQGRIKLFCSFYCVTSNILTGPTQFYQSWHKDLRAFHLDWISVQNLKINPLFAILDGETYTTLSAFVSIWFPFLFFFHQHKLALLRNQSANLDFHFNFANM